MSTAARSPSRREAEIQRRLAAWTPPDRTLLRGCNGIDFLEGTALMPEPGAELH